MEEEEFDLSKKEWESTDHGSGEDVMAYWKEDVKEFIKLLLDEREGELDGVKVRRLAGEKLT